MYLEGGPSGLVDDETLLKETEVFLFENLTLDIAMPSQKIRKIFLLYDLLKSKKKSSEKNFRLKKNSDLFFIIFKYVINR